MHRLLMPMLLGLSLSLSACGKKEEAAPPVTSYEGVQKDVTVASGATEDQAMETLISEAKVKIDQQIQGLDQEQKAAAQKLDFPLNNL